MAIYNGYTKVAGNGGSGGGGTTTCNYNYSQLSGTVEDIVEGNNAAIGSMVETKLANNNTAIGTVVQNKLTSNNPTINGYITGNNNTLSSMIKQLIQENGNAMAQGYDIDENGNLVIFSKTPSAIWNFQDSDFIQTISSDNLLYIPNDGNGVFNELGSLYRVDLKAVKTIGNQAFYACAKNLNKTTFEFNAPNVKTIGTSCFSGLCDYTTSKAIRIYIPNVETIGGSSLSKACFQNVKTNSMDIYINGNITQVPSVDSSGTFGINSGAEKIKVHVKSSMLSKFQSDTNWASYVSSGVIEFVAE